MSGAVSRGTSAPPPGLAYMKSWGPTRANGKFKGLLRPKPRSHTQSLLPESLGQTESQSQLRFQGGGSGCQLLMGGMA